MGIPFFIVGIDAVNLNNKIELTFFEIVRIKKYLSGKIRKMSPDRRVNMFYFKQNA